VSAHQVEGGNGQSEGERGSWGRLNMRPFVRDPFKLSCQFCIPLIWVGLDVPS
jgi:hypothetical protein